MSEMSERLTVVDDNVIDGSVIVTWPGGVPHEGSVLFHDARTGDEVCGIVTWRLEAWRTNVVAVIEVIDDDDDVTSLVTRRYLVVGTALDDGSQVG